MDRESAFLILEIDLCRRLSAHIQTDYATDIERQIEFARIKRIEEAIYVLKGIGERVSYNWMRVGVGGDTK